MQSSSCMNSFRFENTRFSAMIFKALDVIEIIALVGTFIGIVLGYLQQPGYLETLMIFLSTLSATFFLRAIQPPEKSKQPADNEERLGFIEFWGITIIPKAAWIGCAMAITGILFWILKLNGAREQLMTGSIALGVSLVIMVAFLLIQPHHAQKLMKILYRAVPVFLTTIYLFMNTAP